MWAGPSIFSSTNTGDVWIIPSFFNWGSYAACWACFMWHHKYWPISASHPFSLNSSSGLAGGKHYQKITIPIFRLVLQNFALPGCFPYILFYLDLLSLLSSGWFVTLWPFRPKGYCRWLCPSVHHPSVNFFSNQLPTEIKFLCDHETWFTQGYFQVCTKYGPYFWVLFDPGWGQNRSKVSFSSILQKVSTGFTRNLFFELTWTTFRNVFNMGPKGPYFLSFLTRIGPK